MDADLSIDSNRISVDDAVEQIPASPSVPHLIRPENTKMRAWT